MKKPEIALKLVETESALQFLHHYQGVDWLVEEEKKSWGKRMEAELQLTHESPKRPCHVVFMARSTVGDATKVGRDAGKVAEEVIAYLSDLVGAKDTVTLEISAEIPAGVQDNVVRIVTENSCTLRFTSQGFEKE